MQYLLRRGYVSTYLETINSNLLGVMYIFYMQFTVGGLQLMQRHQLCREGT